MPEAPPATPPAPAPNQVPGKDPVQPPKKRSRAKLLFTFLGGFLFLFLLFLVLMVVMLLQNGGNNPILQALGVEAALLKQLLGTLVSLVFGFLSFVSFLVLAVALFRRFTSTAVEVEKKKNSVVLAIVSGLFFAISVFLWLVLFFYISQLQTTSQGSAVILTKPADLVGLSAPVDVIFSAQELQKLYARQGIVSYAWDLDGDGDFDDGTGLQRQHRYAGLGSNNGIYDVAVKVVLTDGTEQVVERRLTISNVRPQPSISYSPEVLEVPVEVTFDASDSRDPDGSIIAYEWDFTGDGESDAEGEKVQWTFDTVGDQKVVLSVKDSNGEVVSEELDLVLEAAPEKQAVIVARPGLQGTVPFKVFLDAEESYLGEKAQSFEWDFGDGGQLKKGRRVQHVYTTPGEYTVRLTATGQSGTEFLAEEQLIAQKRTQAPLALITAVGKTLENGVLKGEAPFEVTFDGGSSRDSDGAVLGYSWDFDGDGKEDAVGETASHTFVDEGTYEVSLTVVDDEDLSSIQKMAVQVVVPEISVQLQVEPSSGTVPLEVTFDASGSRAQEGSIVSYNWDFDSDGVVDVIGSARQTHIYPDVGEHHATVSVLTSDGKRESTEALIVVREIELQADFSVNPAALSSGKKVFFDASLSQGQVSQYFWQFGDGATSRLVKPEHVYDDPGSYEVTLEIYDRRNRISRKQVTIEVQEP